jgi:hypothetical protein
MGSDALKAPNRDGGVDIIPDLKLKAAPEEGRASRTLKPEFIRWRRPAASRHKRPIRNGSLGEIKGQDGF